MELQVVSKYLLKKQKHTQTPKGLTSPILKLHLLSVCSSKGNLLNSSFQESWQWSPAVFNQDNMSPEKCLETNVWKCLSGYHDGSVEFLALVTWEQDARCPAIIRHTKKSLSETLDSSPLQAESEMENFLQHLTREQWRERESELTGTHPKYKVILWDHHKLNIYFMK